MERGEGPGWEKGDVCEGVEEDAPEALEVEVKGVGRTERDVRARYGGRDEGAGMCRV